MKKKLTVSTALILVMLTALCGCESKSYFEGQNSVEAAPVREEAAQVKDETAPQETAPQEVIVKVYVYNDTDSKVVVEGAESTDKSGLVDINTASRDELMSLTGIGGTKADAIITYRNENGSFSKTEDLKNVSGIGDGTYEKIKDKITV